jgi:hypothetical protein
VLLIPPMTQLNTPYPSTAYLTGFLRSRGGRGQEDLALGLVLRCSRAGLARRDGGAGPAGAPAPPQATFLAEFDRYRATVAR